MFYTLFSIFILNSVEWYLFEAEGVRQSHGHHCIHDLWRERKEGKVKE